MRGRVIGVLTGLLAAVLATAARGEDFAVTDNSDTGAGTLRWAITQSNQKGGKVNRIHFAFEARAGGRIDLQGLLPAVTSPVIIDGGPGGVVVNGQSLPGAGLRVGPGGARSEIRSLTVTGFGDFAGPVPGIGVSVEADSVKVVSCTIVGNSSAGIWVAGRSASIEGNQIGVDGAGAAAGNGTGVVITPAGRGALVSGNVVSGNVGAGLLLLGASGTRISGNDIGTDRAGTARLGNGGDGVACRPWRDPSRGSPAASGTS